MKSKVWRIPLISVMLIGILFFLTPLAQVLAQVDDLADEFDPLTTSESDSTAEDERTTAAMLTAEQAPERLIVILDVPSVADQMSALRSSRALDVAQEQATVERLVAETNQQQTQLLEMLTQQGVVEQSSWRFTYLANGFVAFVRPEAQAALAKTPGVQAVFPDGQMELLLGESVPLVGAPLVWDKLDASGLPVRGQGVRVGIIDSGIDYTHPDLGGCFGSGCKVMGGYDFGNNDGDPKDETGHGTRVASIVAANGMVRGVAPEAMLFAYKVFDSSGAIWTSAIAKALEQALVDRVSIVNISLRVALQPNDAQMEAVEFLNTVVNRAVDQGITVVAGAGNDSSYGSLGAPAVAAKALTVGATRKSDTLWEGSSRGPVRVGDWLATKPELVAPGVEINAAQLGSGYSPDSGTSYAAPHVTGAVALFKQLHPDWTPVMFKAILMNTARPMGNDPFAEGAGRLQIDQAANSTVLIEPGALKLGQVNEAQPTWSASASLRLRNLSDATQSYQLSINPSFPSGISAQLSRPELLLAPGQSSELFLTVNVDTATAPYPAAQPNIYYGRIQVANGSEVRQVPFTFGAAHNCQKQTQIPAAECLVLETLYRTTNGNNWQHKDGWLVAPPCDWYGVSCEAGHVTRLELAENTLIGPFPAQVSDLAKLQVLDLDGLCGPMCYPNTNEFPGPLPESIGNLSELVQLQLKEVGLTGTIPASLGRLSKLQGLTLAGNTLNGSIPVELGNLSDLRVLNLADNDLIGEIPSQLGQLVNLRELYLDGNSERDTRLTGSIPSELGHLINLEKLTLTYNKLSGQIPDVFGNLPNLQEFRIVNSELNGCLPASLGTLKKLRILELRISKFSCAIPSEFGGMEALEQLILNTNQLTGEIPSSLGNLKQLETLLLSENQLSGNLAPELGNLGNLRVLNLNSNKLSGSIPDSWGNLSQLEDLQLASNQLSGPLPDTFRNLKNIKGFYLVQNQFGGPLPTWWDQLPNIDSINLSDNLFSGSIPAQLGNAKQLKSIFLRNNRLSGAIPVELSNLTNLQTLALDGNQYSGSFPLGLFHMRSLVSLSMSYNQLSGVIPDELVNLTNLVSLDLSSNQLSGSLPTWFASFPQLRNLLLSNNRLAGTIPVQFADKSFRILRLNNNELTGSIPNLKQIMSLDLSSNHLSGVIPSQILAGTQNRFYLNSNQLTGVGLCKLPGTRLFDLGYNLLQVNPNCPDAQWLATQTVPPTNLRISNTAPTSITLNWLPISYTADGGYYEVSAATSLAGAYTVYGYSASKSADSLVVENLVPSSTYCFKLRTFTPAHIALANQKNDLWSDYSAGVCASTLPPPEPVVNTTVDPGDGLCTANECTLREMITLANTTPGSDTIKFAIAGAGPHTIHPLSPLPTLTDAVIIDGYSQPGARPNQGAVIKGWNATLLIQLQGAPGLLDGLKLEPSAGGSVIRGLAIFGFPGSGIFVHGANNRIEGNILGTDILAHAGIGNDQHGVDQYDCFSCAQTHDNQIVGNVIAGNTRNGIRNLYGQRHQIVDNLIGVDFSGAAALGNGGDGIGPLEDWQSAICYQCRIINNVVSGNGRDGIDVSGDSVIQGNLVGVDKSGMVAIPNRGNGIAASATRAVIGGSAIDQANLIAGNGGNGIVASGAGHVGTNNQVVGNLIGVNRQGECLGNLGSGFQLVTGRGSYGWDLKDNVIACNGKHGISVATTDPDPNFGPFGVNVIGNSIYQNGGLGINLGAEGVQANDFQDADRGANGLMNYPTLYSASPNRDKVTVIGMMESLPYTSFTIRFYSSRRCDEPSGHGEGMHYLGESNVTADASGTARIMADLPFVNAEDKFVSATATAPELSNRIVGNSSSEFSACVAVKPSGKATVTIVKSADPQSLQVFTFYGPLGKFYLMDPPPGVIAAIPSLKMMELLPGSHTLSEASLPSWYLAEVRCVGSGHATWQPMTRSISLAVAAGDNLLCTFYNQRRVNLQATLFNDLNGDGLFTANEPFLPGWELVLYSHQNVRVLGKVTDNNGSTVFSNRIPGVYKLCETTKPSWSNTLPSRVDPVLGLPCYTMTLLPGQHASVLFGNTQGALIRSLGEIDPTSGVTISELPDINEPVGEQSEEDGWSQQLFLPMISR